MKPRKFGLEIVLGTFFAGAAVGAVTVLLLAPQSRRASRQSLSSAMSRVRGKLGRSARPASDVIVVPESYSGR